MSKEHFKVKRVIKIEDIKEGLEVGTSDYLLTTEKEFIQFEFIPDEDKIDEVEIKPGVYVAKYIGPELKLEKTEFTNDKVLTSFTHTKVVTDKIDCFFNRLDVYYSYGFEVPKRSMLLYGPPGTGKTQTITQAIKNYSDDKTAIVIWKTDIVPPDDIKELLKDLKYVGVERLFFIAEDIGGVEAEDARINSKSSLLSLLDNQEKTFRIPTMMISTTNFPQMFLENIANRPQRFDDKIEIPYPTASERQELMRFISKGKASEEIIELIATKKFETFTPAHIKESLIRAGIYDKDHKEVLAEMVQEIEKYNKGFSNQKSLGIFGA